MKKLAPIALLVLLCAAAPIDPTSDPGGFLAQLLSFAHTAWPIALLLGLYGVLEISVKLGRTVPAMAWLDRGRITLVLAAGVSVLGAVLDTLLNGGAMQSALIAAMGSLLAVWHPALPVQPKVVA